MFINYPYFYSLSTPEQLDYVFTYGTYLAYRSSVGFGIGLYYVNDFFCEVWVCLASKEARLVRSFTSAGQLAPYAALIQIPPLGQ